MSKGPELSPAWVRRWAVDTGYGLRGFICPHCDAKNLPNREFCLKCNKSLRKALQKEVTTKTSAAKPPEATRTTHLSQELVHPIPQRISGRDIVAISSMFQGIGRVGVSGLLKKMGTDGVIDSHIHVVPMPHLEKTKKDAVKYDFVIGDGNVQQEGSSLEAEYDLVGGGVKSREMLGEAGSVAALQREAEAEFFALLKQKELIDSLAEFRLLFGPICIQEPGSVVPFQILQVLENGL